MARFIDTPLPTTPTPTPAVTEQVTVRRRPTTQPPGVRANKYPGKCTECGQRVEAEQGRLDKVADKWVTSHIVCPENKLPEPVHSDGAKVVYTLLDGVYTVQSPEGHHRTFEVRTQAPDDDFKPGAQVLAYLSGPDNTSDYTRFGHLDTRTGKLRVWGRFREANTLLADAQLLLDNPQDALVAAKCRRCHRTLTVPSSIDAGLGRDCAGKE